MALLMSPEERDILFEKLLKPVDSVLFAGGCNQDIECKPDTEILGGDSIPGNIMLSPGGVARNIAENAARLGIQASLYAPVGDDANGKALLNITKEAGVDTSPCPVFPGKHSCSYAAFLNDAGEMIYAVNDMKLMDSFLPNLIDRDILISCDHLVVDANLPYESLEMIADTSPILLADTVSAHKIHKLKACLNRTACIKPNRLEAEQFCGFSIHSETDFFRACEIFLNCGCEEVFLSAGSEGFYCMNKRGEQLRMKGPEIPIKSVTGAGDAASAAIVLSLLSQLSLKESAYLATLAAAAALLSSGSINSELSLSHIGKISKEYNI